MLASLRLQACPAASNDRSPAQGLFVPRPPTADPLRLFSHVCATFRFVSHATQPVAAASPAAPAPACVSPTAIYRCHGARRVHRRRHTARRRDTATPRATPPRTPGQLATTGGPFATCLRASRPAPALAPARPLRAHRCGAQRLRARCEADMDRLGRNNHTFWPPHRLQPPRARP
eukprot:COSAG06_NODE_6165_length_3074_cov_7.266218_2_plen_175_part_00